MVESHLSRAVALLVATFGIGWLAVISRPEGVLGSEMWPVGLTVAVLLTLPRRYAVAGWAATLVAANALMRSRRCRRMGVSIPLLNKRSIAEGS